MKLQTLCLGLLSCIYSVESTIFGWTTPAGGSTADYDAGDIYLNEGATTIITPVATSTGPILYYEIVSQTPAEFFEIATVVTGVVTLKGSNVLDGNSETLTHTVKISVTDVYPTFGTVTITFKILAGQFFVGYTCLYIGPTVSASTTVTTSAMSSEGSNSILLSSGNTNNDFSIDAASGLMTAKNALTPASGTIGSYTLVLKGVENTGIASTVTSTIYICMRESSCKCAISSSAASHITAGLLGIVVVIIIMISK